MYEFLPRVVIIWFHLKYFIVSIMNSNVNENDIGNDLLEDTPTI